MRYEMRENSQGWDICDTEADVNFGDYFMNIDECVEKMNELDKELQSIKALTKAKYENANDVFGLNLGAESLSQQIEELKAENEKLRGEYNG